MAARKMRQMRMDFDHQPVEWSTIHTLVAEMTEIYLRDDRPWVIGFSGGKDSTCVVQLAYRMLMALPPAKRVKTVWIISSDTLVENPRVAQWLDKCHAELRQVAADHDLPVEVVKVAPSPEDSFWVCLIGKGYPAPTNDFRWCTSRLKIEPSEAYVLEHVEPEGRILQLLGSRKAESKARAQSIEAHALEGKFGTTGSLTNGMSYQPIQEWDNDAAWEYLRLYQTPWNRPDDVVMIPDPLTRQPVPHYNNELFYLYQDGHGGECVLDFDRRTASCGGSRFGCWTCTVVPEDVSMRNMVAMVTPEYAPLLAFRDKIQRYRNDYSTRDHIGRTGQIRLTTRAPEPDADGNVLHGPWVTPGPHWLHIRAEFLRNLFEIEKALPGFRTVTDEDLHWIKHWWEHDGGDPGLVDQIRTKVLGHG